MTIGTTKKLSQNSPHSKTVIPAKAGFQWLRPRIRSMPTGHDFL